MTSWSKYHNVYIFYIDVQRIKNAEEKYLTFEGYSEYLTSFRIDPKSRHVSQMLAEEVIKNISIVSGFFYTPRDYNSLKIYSHLGYIQI